MEKLVGFAPIIISIITSLIICLVIRKNKKLLLTFSILLLIINVVLGCYTLKTPNFVLLGDEKIEINVKSNFSDPGVEASIHNKDLKEKVTTDGQVDVNKVGEYTITYNLKYLISDETLSRTVEVKDKETPVLTLKGDSEFTLYSGATYNEPGCTAMDNYDGDISAGIETKKEEISDKKYKIIYTVKDSSGNEAKIERIVTIVDPPKPSSSKNGVIYLTFDDGPSANITPHILDILKKQNVKATFFIINYSDANEYLVKRIVNEGHTIAIHGYSHDYRSIYSSEQAYMNNLNKLQEKIKNSTGVKTTVTRFPGGSSNTTSKFNPGIMTRLTKLVIANGYQYYDWNIECGDAAGAKTKEQVYNNVVKYLSKKKSNLVLMHDFSGNNKTLNALNDIINYGKNNGYTFDRINEDTPAIHHGVNN
ncbi:MAG: polysaccharide deacetylase [Clostridia bacterium]|nr:polysaccharide deacetylase [Clostridia bacterium]